MTVYASERDSAAALDDLLERSGLFVIYREVAGTLLQPRLGQIDKGMRIDRLLVPTNELLSRGWSQGIIGVEIKKDPAGTLGPAISQAMDYTRSVFTLAPSGFQVMPAWVFLWPMPKQSGPMASVLAQNRLGSLSDTGYGILLQFKSGEANILRVHRDGRVDVGACSSGLKAGSR